MQFGQRYYIPNNYSWTQLDPSVQSPGYEFAEDNPANLSDPTGQDSVLSSCAAGAVTGVSVGAVTGADEAGGGAVEAAGVGCLQSVAGSLVDSITGSLDGTAGDPALSAVDLVSSIF